jgi:hypothetical protein
MKKQSLIAILFLTICNIGHAQTTVLTTDSTLAIPKLTFDVNGELVITASASRLAGYTTLAGVTLAASAAAPNARAAIVWSGPIFINIPSNIDGIYLNLVTGVIGTSGASVPGWDVNPYGTSSLTMFSTTGTA